MNFSPKLKKAAEEIKAILKKHDIAGVVVLHNIEGFDKKNMAIGFSEYLMHIKPSYSAANIDSGHLQVKLKFSHYGNDKVKQQQMAAGTANMLGLLSEVTGNMTLGLMDMDNALKSVLDVESTDTTHTSHNEQNN